MTIQTKQNNFSWTVLTQICSIIIFIASAAASIMYATSRTVDASMYIEKNKQCIEENRNLIHEQEKASIELRGTVTTHYESINVRLIRLEKMQEQQFALIKDMYNDRRRNKDG